jgi:hypothetical protein
MLSHITLIVGIYGTLINMGIKSTAKYFVPYRIDNGLYGTA